MIQPAVKFDLTWLAVTDHLRFCEKEDADYMF